MNPAPAHRDNLSRIKQSLVPSLAIVLLAVFLPACRYVRTRPGLPTLSRVEEILKLSPAEALRGYPVRLQAAVTYYDPEWHVLYVQDSTAGIYVNTGGRKLSIESGQMVEIVASTEKPNELTDAQIQQLGPTLMPTAKDATLKQAAAGGELLNQWVRVTGTVRAAEMQGERVILRMAGHGGQLRAILLNTKDINPAGLIDARISIEGVCGAHLNERGEMDGTTLLVTNHGQIIVQEHPVADPFSMVPTSVERILTSTPENYPVHRVRLKAIVVEQKDGGWVSIKDETGQIWVHAEQITAVQSGVAVDVVGFADLSDSAHILQQAIVHPFNKSNSTFKTPGQQQTTVLTNVAQVRRLTPEEASDSKSVQIRGVVTYHDPAWGLLFVQDSTGGIYVDTHGQELDLQAGDVVQVDGISSPGDFAPIISRPNILVLDDGEMPEPVPLAAARLITGKEDSQFIETTGVVRSLSQDPNHLFLNIDAAGTILKAQIPNFGQGIPSQLIDSEIRVQAVCGTIFNKMRQLIGVQLFISHLEDIVVERATHDDPFSTPARSINSLLRFAPEEGPGHRIKVAGTVTMQRSKDSFFIQDYTGGLFVQTDQSVSVTPGDTVEVLGFPMVSGYTPVLQNSVFRKIGTAPVPTPLTLTGDSAMTGNYDSVFVQIEARVLQELTSSAERVFVLQSGQIVFNAHLPQENSNGNADAIEPGSLVRLVGVCSVQVTDSGAARVPSSFRILLRDREDITVLQRPTWWTATRTLAVLGLMAVLIVVVLGWVATLRRRVRQQTQTIRCRLENEAALEQRYGELFENARDIIFTLDLKGNFTSLNSAAEQFSGYSREEVLKMNIMQIVAPEDRDSATYLDGNALDNSESIYELNAIRKNGSVRTLEISSRPIYDNSRAVGIQGIARDVTERKEMEADLEKARDVAVKSARLKSEFLANMSHEIRTPMNGIIGMTELALETDLSDEQREYLGMVKQSAESLLVVINDILDFSKIEAGKIDIDAVDFNLGEAIGNLIRPLAVRADEKGLEITTHVTPDVPEFLSGDVTRLQQILVNLIGNAIKFTEHGEVCLSIEKETQSESEVVLHLKVKDTGIGIPPEKQALVFEAFAQADGSTTRKYGGTGLGLAITAQLVDLMSGKIWVESSVGTESTGERGSTFHVVLPFGVAKTVASTPADLSQLENLPVLVVDDNATNRKILEETLLTWGMHVTAVDSGLAALTEMKRAATANRAFKLLLLDMHMPEMDGIELMKNIKQCPELGGAAIMMLSSADLSKQRSYCRELGLDILLVKPIWRLELLSAIRKVLGTRIQKKDDSAMYRGQLTETSGRKLQILLAEDNAINQLVATNVLKKQGHAVTVANNGKQAVVMFVEGNFDVVLMDVQMPEMNGFDATGLIRQHEQLTKRHTPIIAMTAYAMTGDRERCLAAGMDAYISKPLQARELLHKLAELTSTPTDAMNGNNHDSDRIVSALVERVEGDVEVARQVAEVFVEDCPKLLRTIREALNQRDPEKLKQTAHTMKGSVCYFANESATEAAQRLETQGSNNDFENAVESLRDLELALEQIMPVVSNFAETNVCERV